MRTQHVTLGTQHVILIFSISNIDHCMGIPALIHAEHIFLIFSMHFTWPVIMSLSHDMSTVKNMPSGHIKLRKGSGYVFKVATPCHTTESVLLMYRGYYESHFGYANVISLVYGCIITLDRLM